MRSSRTPPDADDVRRQADVCSGVGRAHKQAIAVAAAAARLIRPGTAIALSAGTTTWALSPYLADIDGLTIVTNSTTVADTIADLPGSSRRTVILTGGVRTPSAALVGPIADIGIRAIHVDQLFLGVHGMAAHAGYTSPNLAEAQTNKELISRASQVGAPSASPTSAYHRTRSHTCGRPSGS